MVLQECPICHRKQSVNHKKCSCGEDLAKAKRSQRIRYWIQYRIPGTGQRKEYVGTSIEEARDADGKRRVQKREGRIFDMLPESKLTFQELTDWYCTLPMVKKLSSFTRVEQGLKAFNAVFADKVVGSATLSDLESYQCAREQDGAAPASIDMEISIVKTMVTRAIDHDKLAVTALKPFRKVKRRLHRGANARRKILTITDYLKLLAVAPLHLKAMITLGFHTGMRMGELRALQWSHIDQKKAFIRLPPSVTKEARSKVIPINHHVRSTLDSLPRHIDHPFVITYHGQPITQPNGIKKSLITACQHATRAYGRNQSDGLTFHDFRRTCKTYMLMAGVDKAIRDLIVGHSLQGMDIHYLVPTDDALTAAMDKFTAWVDAQITQAKAQTQAQTQAQAQIANVTQSVTQEPKIAT